MAKLIEVASRVMDLYYQNYPTNDRFIDLADFRYQVAITYSAMLNAIYQQQRRETKQETGFNNVEYPSQWLLTEDYKIQHDEKADKLYITTSNPIFSFDYDDSSGIQDIFGSCQYRKVTKSERRYRGITPPASVVFYYLNSANEIIFWNAKKDANISINYLPQVDGENDNCLLSDNIVPALQEQVLKTMFEARSGTIIDKTNDQNPTK